MSTCFPRFLWGSDHVTNSTMKRKKIKSATARILWSFFINFTFYLYFDVAVSLLYFLLPCVTLSLLIQRLSQSIIVPSNTQTWVVGSGRCEGVWDELVVDDFSFQRSSPLCSHHLNSGNRILTRPVPTSSMPFKFGNFSWIYLVFCTSTYLVCLWLLVFVFDSKHVRLQVRVKLVVFSLSKYKN